MQRNELFRKAPGMTDTILDVRNIEVVYNTTVQVLRGSRSACARGQVGGAARLQRGGQVHDAQSHLQPAGAGGRRRHLRAPSPSTGRPSPARSPRAGAARPVPCDGGAAHLRGSERGGEPHGGHLRPLRPRRAAPDFDTVYEYFPRLHERRTGRAGYLSGGEQQMAGHRPRADRPAQAHPAGRALARLSPKLVVEIFTFIAASTAERGVSMLLVEQNAGGRHGGRSPMRATSWRPARW